MRSLDPVHFQLQSNGRHPLHDPSLRNPKDVVNIGGFGSDSFSSFDEDQKKGRTFHANHGPSLRDHPRRLASSLVERLISKLDLPHFIGFTSLTDVQNTTANIDDAKVSLERIGFKHLAVSAPYLVPTVDFVPIPGRMRLRLSGVSGGDHRLRSDKWSAF